MVRIIEHVWCLICNEMFLCDKAEEYICPKCNNKISYETETMRTIVDK